MKKQLFAILGLTLALGITACNGNESTPATSNSSESQVSSTSSKSVEPSTSVTPSSTTSSSSTSTSSQASTSSSSSSTSSHTHNYGTLNAGHLPSYFFDGMKPHYYCIECGQYFDENKNPTTEEALKLPKATDNIAFLVDGNEKETFELVEKTESAVSWKLTNRGIDKNSVLGIAKPGDPTYKYGFFAGNNIDENNKPTIGGQLDIFLVATPNGFQLSVEEHISLVVKVNSTEYPMNHVTYLDGTTKTYIYGYHNFTVGDKMTVVDKSTNEVFDYDDIADDTKWNKYDFHKGTNNEFVFDKAGRYGIEFGRGGEEEISVSKTFGPSTGIEYKVAFNSERPAEALTKHSYAPDTDAYKESTWYTMHEAVINADDIREALANGYDMYTANITFASNEEFNVKDITNNATINGDHLVSFYGDDDCFTLSGDYIKVLKEGKYSVYYIPCCDGIAFATIAAPGDANIMVNNAFVTLTKDANGVVTYTDHFDKNDYVVFADDSYNMITPTLASSVDKTAVHLSSFLIYFDKAGTFKLDLNLTTKVLDVTVVELDDPGQEQQGPITGAYIIGSGMSARMENNPDNPDELMKKNVQFIASGDMVYIAIYDESLTDKINGVTLSTDSASVAMEMGGLIFLIGGSGTYDFYLNKNTLVLRIVKVS